MIANERWHRVAELFSEAVERHGPEREAFLAQACASDPSLRAEVDALLAEQDGAPGFLEDPTHLRGRRAALPPTGATPAVPELEQVGPYRVLGRIGEGGMGIVYRVEQKHPNRVAALKVLRPGVVTKETLRRFEHESHVLGRLQHPGIAQVFEAGTADVGFGPQPYFAMEFIEGLPLDAYARSHALTGNQCLELMARVCDAVHHAHQKGVVHRDLKPGNILVDASGQPKVLDFGVARITDSDLQVTTLQTQVGQLVGTIQYMSPEQAAADPDEIDPRSDVYSLGVITYELLAQQLPHDFSGRKFHEAVRMVAEEEARPLGTTTRLYRGDVETIVGKALELDKERRYDSARELADDLRRYLRDEPILARPASSLYQLRKFARRNRALVGGVIAFVALLLVSVVVSLGLTFWAVREQGTAQRRFQETRAMTLRFVNVDDKIRNLVGATEARELLVKTALEFHSRLGVQESDDPTLRRELATLLSLVADVQGKPGIPNLGKPEAALAHQRSALVTREELVAADPQDPELRLELAESHRSLAVLLLSAKDLDLAKRHCEQGLALLSGLPASTAAREAEAAFYEFVGSIQTEQRHFDAAIDSFAVSRKIREELLSAESLAPTLHRQLTILDMLTAVALVGAGRGDDATQCAEVALERARQLVAAHPGDVHALRDLAIACDRHGNLLLRMARAEAARVALRENHEICRQLVAADASSLQARVDLAISCERLARALPRGDEEAHALNRDAVQLYEELQRADPKNRFARRSLRGSYVNLYDSYKASSDTTRGSEILEALGKLVDRDLPEDRDPEDVRHYGAYYKRLGNELLQKQQWSAAESCFARACEFYQQLLVVEPTEFKSQVYLVESQVGRGDALARQAATADDSHEKRDATQRAFDAFSDASQRVESLGSPKQLESLQRYVKKRLAEIKVPASGSSPAERATE
ncbi:MAG: protein kinase [Planctomycetota bacterium]